MLIVVSLGSLLFFGPKFVALSAQDDELVVFDLSTEHTLVTDHSAHFLFNLNTDNITNESVELAWNSMYKRAGSEVAGKIEVDVAAGTVRGELTELWVCDGNCDELDGETYADKMDTGWAATIDAYLDSPGSAGNFAGTVDLFYSVAVAYDESPSTCNGEVCYVCANQVCTFTETMTGTTRVEGLWDGESLVLSYADRLEPDAADMNFDGLRDVQFIMGRASLTMAGTVPAATPPPDEPPPEQVEDTGADEIEQSAPDDTDVQTDVAADPPASSDSTEATADEAAEDTDVASAASPAQNADKGGISKTALFVGVIILMMLLFGFGFARQIWMIFRKAPGSIEDAERAALFSPDLLTADPGDGPPAEGALDKPPPKPPPAPVFEPTGSQVSTEDLEPNEVNPYATYELVSPTGEPHVEIAGPVRDDGSRNITRLEVGSRIKVVGMAGDAVKVHIPGSGASWIDKKYVTAVYRAGK